VKLNDSDKSSEAVNETLNCPQTPPLARDTFDTIKRDSDVRQSKEEFERTDSVNALYQGELLTSIDFGHGNDMRNLLMQSGASSKSRHSLDLPNASFSEIVAQSSNNNNDLDSIKIMSQLKEEVIIKKAA
jgi:hypothetical protein